MSDTKQTWPERGQLLQVLEKIRQMGPARVDFGLVHYYLGDPPAELGSVNTTVATNRALHNLADEGGVLAKRYYVECTEHGCEDVLVEWKDFDREAELFCPVCDCSIDLPEDATDVTTRFWFVDPEKEL